MELRGTLWVWGGSASGGFSAKCLEGPLKWTVCFRAQLLAPPTRPTE